MNLYFRAIDPEGGNITYKNFDNNNRSWIKFISTDCNKVEKCSGEKCTGYRGTQNKTMSERTCQAWDAQAPHSHKRTPENYGKAGLIENYCRNPDNEPTIWCYTTDPDKRWEHCAPVNCENSNNNEVEKCSGKGCSEYRGTQNKTINGKTCQAWDTKIPHVPNSEYYPTKKVSAGLDDNYCRNPSSNYGTIWCYTTDLNTRWEDCAPKGSELLKYHQSEISVIPHADTALGKYSVTMDAEDNCGNITNGSIEIEIIESESYSSWYTKVFDNLLNILTVVVSNIIGTSIFFALAFCIYKAYFEVETQSTNIQNEPIYSSPSYPNAPNAISEIEKKNNTTEPNNFTSKITSISNNENFMQNSQIRSLKSNPKRVDTEENQE